MTRAEYIQIRDRCNALFVEVVNAIDGVAQKDGTTLLLEYRESLYARDNAYSALSHEDRISILVEQRVRRDEILAGKVASSHNQAV